MRMAVNKRRGDDIISGDHVFNEKTEDPQSSNNWRFVL